MGPDSRGDDDDAAADDAGDVRRYQTAKRQRVLRDIAGLYLLLEQLPDTVQRDGLTQADLRACVEPVLRHARIPLLPFNAAYESRSPWLYVNVHALRLDDHAAYTLSIEVSVRDNVVLEREPRPTDPITAATWSEQTLLWTRAASLRKSVCDAVTSILRRFADDYFAANA
jgi:hypothetical protein